MWEKRRGVRGGASHEIEGAGDRLGANLTRLVERGDVERVAMGRLMSTISVGHSAFCLRCSSVPKLLTRIRGRVVRRVRHTVHRRPVSPKGSAICCFVRSLFRILSRGHRVTDTLMKPRKSVNFMRGLRRLLRRGDQRSLTTLMPRGANRVGCFCSCYLGNYLNFIGA